MARLAPVLGTDDLPLAELCAARLDGEVAELGFGWVPVDEPDLPALRAAAVDAAAPGLIIERFSAAWVLGAIDVCPRPAQACVPHETRTARRSDESCVVREVRIASHEILALGAARCTTVERTVFDLARDPASDHAAAIAAIAGLERCRPGSAGGVLARIADLTRMPHKALAVARLRVALASVPLSRR